MKNILFIHQSAELYGSDKTLFTLVLSLKERALNPIVILPNDGPLKELLDKNDITTYIIPVLKISRKMFAPLNLLKLPFQAISSIRSISNVTRGLAIDIVYSNTLAVLLGFLYAIVKNKKHIWHVHEIIEKPELVKKIFSALIHSSTNSKIIFNSYATQKYWNLNIQKRVEKNVVIWNGLDKVAQSFTPNEISNYRKKHWDANEGDIIIGLVGRINRWKGQQLLLDSFLPISAKYKHVKLVFVGSAPPNQEEYLNGLIEKVEESGLRSKVFIHPFQNNIWEIWESIDIAVVPSTEPEPFGLVAIEAMLAKKPVIAAQHGGLEEIVLDKETGLLFAPNNSESLMSALDFLIVHNIERNEMGQAGFNRALNYFNSKKYVDQIEKTINGL